MKIHKIKDDGKTHIINNFKKQDKIHLTGFGHHPEEKQDRLKTIEENKQCHTKKRILKIKMKQDGANTVITIDGFDTTIILTNFNRKDLSLKNFVNDNIEFFKTSIKTELQAKKESVISEKETEYSSIRRRLNRSSTDNKYSQSSFDDDFDEDKRPSPKLHFFERDAVVKNNKIKGVSNE